MIVMPFKADVKYSIQQDAADCYDEAKKKGWTVISMKNDWKKVFAFESLQAAIPARPRVEAATTERTQ